MIEVNERVAIPETELSFTASRGGGPGGQHVNKVSSRVTLAFDLDGSPSLTDADKARIRTKLGNRISKSGVLQLSSHASRSQVANREALRERFRILLRDALRRRRGRRPTRPTRSSHERRLTSKRRRARLKRDRRRVREERD